MAAQTGTRPEKIRIQKWYTIYKVTFYPSSALSLSLLASFRERSESRKAIKVVPQPAVAHCRTTSRSQTTRCMMAWA